MQDIIARGGIDAADRLVEQIELRSAAHGKHELDLFLHALGHLTDGLVVESDATMRRKTKSRVKMYDCMDAIPWVHSFVRRNV